MPLIPKSRRLAASATGYVEAARFLVEHRAGGGLEHWPAGFINLGFATELSLKAVILERGGDDALLRDIGHNLRRGLDEARARAPEALLTHRGFDKLVDTLGPPFRDMSLRYMLGDEIELLDLAEAFLVVRELHVVCGQVIEPDFAKGLKEIDLIDLRDVVGRAANRPDQPPR